MNSEYLTFQFVKCTNCSIESAHTRFPPNPSESWKMSATVSLKIYSECVSCTYDTARARLSGFAHTMDGGVQRFTLADVLSTLKKSERNAVPALFKAAEIVPCLTVGESIVATARRLEAWLNAEESRRLAECRVRFIESLSALQTGDLFLFAERLRLAVQLHLHVLAYVLGLRPDQPNWPVFGPQFAIANASASEDLLNEYQKESAHG